MYIHLAGFLFYYYLRMKYGACDFSKTRTTGIYNVGFSRFAAEKGNFCAVYYPVDKFIGHKSQKKEDLYNNEPVIATRLADFAKNIEWATGGKKKTPFQTFLLPALSVSVPVFIDANLAPEFILQTEETEDQDRPTTAC